MDDTNDAADRISLQWLPDSYRRIVAGREVIIHCHHYNSRIQATIEGSTAIDGKRLFRAAAESVFAGQIAELVQPDDCEDEKWTMVEALYSYLGYGKLDFSRVGDGLVTASSSHFVEGWNAGFAGRSAPVCTMAEGFIQAAIYAISGELVDVREECCLLDGSNACKLVVHRGRHAPIEALKLRGFTSITGDCSNHIFSANVDEAKIVDAVVGLPIYGNNEGLIPTFNVYLANTPADFYNWVSIRFLEEMQKKGLRDMATKLLVHDAETCAMNTFRGIMASPEWAGLVQPMIKEQSDELFGILAISNALGWGNWHAVEHTPCESLSLQTSNGYEGAGYRSLRDATEDPQCYMLTGVSAGMMELIYGAGPMDERMGLYTTQEKTCVCCAGSACQFDVRLAA